MIHKHLIIKSEVNSPLTNPLQANKFLESLIDKIHMKTMYGPVAQYCEVEGNRGITCFAIIETSHIALHIWDEVKPALIHLDVYSCKDFESQIIYDHLQSMDPKKIYYKFVDRENEFTVVV